jgi:hypothetical protein
MKTKKIILTSVALVIAMAVIMPGCASKKEAAWGSLKNGMIMSYSLNPDRDLNYTSNFDFEQQMTVMNQEFTINAEMMQVFYMQPVESESEDLEYNVTVADMTWELESPNGKLTPDLDDVIGKSFMLTLSKLGKEIEYSGAEEISFELGTGEKKTISSDIQAFFPDLPDHPVKPGDSWNSTDEVVEKGNTMEMKLVFNLINTFEGLESYGGYDCMKVKVVFTGSISGDGNQDGYELLTKGDLEGTSTWYYAYKEGFFVATTVNGSGTTETEVIGADMVIPATRTYTMTTVLSN